MPTLVIPASDPWPRDFVVDEHFIPLQATYSPTLIQSYTDAQPGALTDPTGAAGYLYLDIGGYEAAEQAASGFTDSYGIGSGGGAVPTPLTITASKVTAIRAVAVARAVSGFHAPQLLGDRAALGGYSDAGLWAPGATFGAMTSTWTRYTSAASSSIWNVPALWTDFTGRAAAGALSVEFDPYRVVGEPQGVVHVAWLAIEIDYLGGPKPLRQFPRTDGLAASSARRMWPPSRSIQRSNRQGPGAYL